ncbi:hypothetical protein PLESTB_001836700 [Pleodorina starrii]|uniref:Uncharacterized protein n=1 Tax=Pleodorina starrii TaxID=330485 RepID=A0A9W6C157_9CHLO|nr:hypothetical protein PLESTB_001836700 [Pleodorina starrii]
MGTITVVGLQESLFFLLRQAALVVVSLLLVAAGAAALAYILRLRYDRNRTDNVNHRRRDQKWHAVSTPRVHPSVHDNVQELVQRVVPAVDGFGLLQLGAALSALVEKGFQDPAKIETMCGLGLAPSLGSVLYSLTLRLRKPHHGRRGLGRSAAASGPPCAFITDQADVEAQRAAAKALGAACLQASWLLVQLASGSPGTRRALLKGVHAATITAFMRALAPDSPLVSTARGSRPPSSSLACEFASSADLRASSSGLVAPGSDGSCSANQTTCPGTAVQPQPTSLSPTPEQTQQQPRPQPCHGDRRLALPGALLDAVLRNCSWCLLLLCDVAWALPAFGQSQEDVGDVDDAPAGPEALERSRNMAEVELAVEVGRVLLLPPPAESLQQQHKQRQHGPCSGVWYEGSGEGAPAEVLVQLVQSWEGLEASVTAAAVLSCLALLEGADAELAQRALERLLASPTFGHVCEALCRAGFLEASALTTEVSGCADAGSGAGPGEDRHAAYATATIEPPTLHSRPLARACTLLSQFLSRALSQPQSAGLLLRQAVADHAVSWLLHAPVLPLGLRRQMLRQLLGTEGHGALSAAATQLVDAPLALCHIISAPPACHSLLTPDVAGFLVAAAPFGFMVVQPQPHVAEEVEPMGPVGGLGAAAAEAGAPAHPQHDLQQQLVADGVDADWEPDAALLGAQALGGPQDQGNEQDEDFMDANEDDPWVGGAAPANGGAPAFAVVAAPHELQQMEVVGDAAAAAAAAGQGDGGVGVVDVRAAGGRGAAAAGAGAERPVSTLAVACRLLLASGRLDNAFGAFFSDLRAAGQAALNRRNRRACGSGAVVASFTRRGSLDGRLRELNLGSSVMHQGMMAALRSAHGSSSGGGASGDSGSGGGTSAGALQTPGHAGGLWNVGLWLGAGPGALAACGSTGHSSISHGSGASVASAAAAVAAGASAAAAAVAFGRCGLTAETSSGEGGGSSSGGGGRGDWSGGEASKTPVSSSSAGSSSGGGALTDVMAGVAGLMDAMLWRSASLGGDRGLRGGFIDAYDSEEMSSESTVIASQLSQERLSLDGGSLSGSAGAGACQLCAASSGGWHEDGHGGAALRDTGREPSPPQMGTWGSDPRVGGLPVGGASAAVAARSVPAGGSGLVASTGWVCSGSHGAGGSETRRHNSQEPQSQQQLRLGTVMADMGLSRDGSDTHCHIGDAALYGGHVGDLGDTDAEAQQQQHQQQRAIRTFVDDEDEDEDARAGASLVRSAMATWLDMPSSRRGPQRQRHESMPCTAAATATASPTSGGGGSGFGLPGPSYSAAECELQRTARMDADGDGGGDGRYLPCPSFSDDMIRPVAGATSDDVYGDVAATQALGTGAGLSCGGKGWMLRNPDGDATSSATSLRGGPGAIPCRATRPSDGGSDGEGNGNGSAGPRSVTPSWRHSDAGCSSSGGLQGLGGCGGVGRISSEPGGPAAALPPPTDLERTSTGSSVAGQLPPYTYFGSPQLTAAALAVPVDVATIVTSMLSATDRSSNTAARRIALAAAAAAAAAAATASSAGAPGATTAATTLAASAARAKATSAAAAAAAWPGAAGAAGGYPWPDESLLAPQHRRLSGAEEPNSDTQLAVDNGSGAHDNGTARGGQLGQVASLSQGVSGTLGGSGSTAGAGAGSRYVHVPWTARHGSEAAPGTDIPAPGLVTGHVAGREATMAAAAAARQRGWGSPHAREQEIGPLVTGAAPFQAATEINAAASVFSSSHAAAGLGAVAVAQMPSPLGRELTGMSPRSVSGFSSNTPLWVRCSGFGACGASQYESPARSSNPGPSPSPFAATHRPHPSFNPSLTAGAAQPRPQPQPTWGHSGVSCQEAHFAHLGGPLGAAMWPAAPAAAPAAAAAAAVAVAANTAPLALVSSVATAATAAATFAAQPTSAHSAPLTSTRFTSSGVTGPVAAAEDKVAAVFAFGSHRVEVASRAFRALRRCSPLLYRWLSRVPDWGRPITLLQIPGLDDSANHRVFLQLLAWAQGARDVGLLLMLPHQHHHQQGRGLEEGQSKPQGQAQGQQQPASEHPLQPNCSSSGEEPDVGGPQPPAASQCEGRVEPLEQLWQLWRAADYLQVDELLTGVEDELAGRFTLPAPAGPAAWAAALSLAGCQQHLLGASSRLAHLCALHFMRSVWGVLARLGGPGVGADEDGGEGDGGEDLLVAAGAGAGVLAPAVAAEVRDRLVALVALADQDLSGAE